MASSSSGSFDKVQPVPDDYFLKGSLDAMNNSARWLLSKITGRPYQSVQEEAAKVTQQLKQEGWEYKQIQKKDSSGKLVGADGYWQNNKTGQIYRPSLGDFIANAAGVNPEHMQLGILAIVTVAIIAFFKS